MALLCYNKGCGQRFDPEHNSQDSCLYHPGDPIFHDALKGWSCCKKRTTDFSEFLSIKGCTKGFHSKEKPPEPSQEETSDKPKAKPMAEIIVQGPKSAEKMQRERPSSDEPRQLLPIKVSRSLEQALEKLSLSPNNKEPKGDCTGEAAAQVRAGTTCKNATCKAIYQGPESNTEVCTFHPGVPVFHEGMKYWSCCGIRTTDFSAFLEQPGCSTGRHCWMGKADKKAVSCRQDWHQTSSQVVVTIYGKNPLPTLSSVKANRTVLEVHVIFEGNKIFQAELDLWGVIEAEKSFVSMVPTKVEIALRKANPGAWARLEHPQSKACAQGEPEKAAVSTEEPEDDSDDSLSWSEEDEEVEAADGAAPLRGFGESSARADGALSSP
ncbi:rho-related GTP-binding protein RhoG-like isoform X1 [Gallus gallus]|uniref:rho-related GTP-binding protein RhoG-like isoform X1 n=1 Tax=Gallus gallus TaxID=9031 RepID=UPI001F026511|nr:rho-related GTP-binding protein RhoG-like isoform X1 [Gallus gallus]